MANNYNFAASGSAQSVMKLLNGSEVPDQLRNLIWAEMKDRESTHDFVVSITSMQIGPNSNVSYAVAANQKIVQPKPTEAKPSEAPVAGKV